MKTLLCLLAFLGFGIIAQAADAPDLNGTWHWKTFFGGNRFNTTAKLKQEGTNVSGVLIRRGTPDSKLSEVRLSGDQIRFVSIRDGGGAKFTNIFEGKVESNSISGSMVLIREQDVRTNKWYAEKVDPKKAVTGVWRWSYQTQNGQTVSSTGDLKHDGEKIDGIYTGRDGVKLPLVNGHFEDGKVAFDVIRTRDGKGFTNHFEGKFAEESIKGSMWIDRGVEQRKLEWDARRGE